MTFMEPNPLSTRDGQILSTNHIFTAKLEGLPTSGVENGAQGFATDARGPGEGAGAGTGIPVWFHAESREWRDYTTGAAATT